MFIWECPCAYWLGRYWGLDANTLNKAALDEAEAAVEEQAAIAEALNNPLSSLWIMFVQNDTYLFKGDIVLWTALSNNYKPPFVCSS